MKAKLLALVLLSIGLSATISSAQINLISNGSFEATGTPVGNNNFSEVPTNNSIDNWSVVFGNVEVVNNVVYGADTGTNFVDLVGVAPSQPTANSGAIAAIEQTFNTLVGATYALTFSYAAQFNSVYTADIDIYSATSPIGPSGLLDVSFATGGSSTVFTPSPTYIFTADNTTATLRFTSTNAPSVNDGLFIDSVSVIPEPSTYVMILGSLVLSVVLWAKRKSNSVTQ